MLQTVLAVVLGACDLDAATAAHLRALTGAEMLPAGVTVQADGQTLHVRWSARERTMATTGRCDADAHIAAVIIAAWLSEQPVLGPSPAAPKAPRRVKRVELPAAGPAPEPASVPVAPEPAPSVEPVVAPRPEAPVSPPRSPVVGVRATLPATTGEPLTSLLAVSLRAAIGDGVAAGGSLSFETGRRFGLVAELSGDGERRLELAGGAARWMRFASAAGAYYRATLGAWHVQPALTFSFAAVVVNGSGFAPSYTAVGVDAGGCASMRLGRELTSSWGVFAVVRGCAWPFSPTLTVAGAFGSVVVPRFDSSLGLGVQWSWLDD